MTNEWDAPDDEEDDEFGPGSADYDLSEQHGYMWEPEREHGPISPGLMIVISALVIVALVLPGLLILLRYG
jgi:hypothetical protein